MHLDVKVQDVELRADRAKLKLILDNLLSNAIKYSPRAAPSSSTRRRSDQLVLDVADTGPGISQEERSAHLRSVLLRARAAGRAHLKGTGIGLSVVIEFVQAHGGTIEIVDGKFPGAHFRIRLPLRQPRRSRQAEPRACGLARLRRDGSCWCLTRRLQRSLHERAGARAHDAQRRRLQPLSSRCQLSSLSRHDGTPARAATPAGRLKSSQVAKRESDARADDRARCDMRSCSRRPGTASSDEAAARDMLTAACSRRRNPCCPPSERSLAVLSQGRRAATEPRAENRRLQANTSSATATGLQSPTGACRRRSKRTHACASELAEAQAKLDAITEIERSIIERSPGNGGK